MANEIRRETENYIAVMERALPRLTSRAEPENLIRQTAASCLARSVSLLRAMRVLADKGFGDHLQLLARTAFETAINGSYILVGDGHDEFLGLAKEHMEAVRKMNNSVDDLGLHSQLVAIVESELEASDGRIVTAPSVETRVQFVTKRAGMPSDEQKSPYDIFYRGTSTTGVHGLGSVWPYIDAPTVGGWRVTSRSPSPVEADTLIMITAFYVGHLAGHVFVVFDLDTVEIESALERLVEARDKRV